MFDTTMMKLRLTLDNLDWPCGHRLNVAFGCRFWLIRFVAVEFQVALWYMLLLVLVHIAIELAS